MAKRHLEEYYKQVNEDYCSFVDEIKELEEICKTSTVSPDVIENMQKMFIPLKTNWQTLNYIMFLLNLPNKKTKEKNMRKKLEQKLKDCRTKDEVISENKLAINNIQSLNEKIRNQGE